MAYMNQERKAKIASLLKPILTKYKVKGSLSVRNHSTIVLSIKSGAIDFIQNYINTVGPNSNGVDYVHSKRCLDVNPYWYQEHFSGTAKKFLSEVLMAMKGADWYDRSDIMTDYFDTAYFVDVSIGQWNKPYEVK
jgi:hypothetical protein